MRYRIGYSSINEVKIAPRLPIAEIYTASYPLPSRSRLWAGRTESAVSSSGAPRNVVGIVS